MWKAKKCIAKQYYIYVIINVLATMWNLKNTGNTGQFCCKLGFGVAKFVEQWEEHRKKQIANIAKILIWF